MSDELAKAIEKHAAAMQALADAKADQNKTNREMVASFVPLIARALPGYAAHVPYGPTRTGCDIAPGEQALLEAFATIWDAVKGNELARVALANAAENPKVGEALRMLVELADIARAQRNTVS